MSAVQETFISHLVELRDRLLRAMLAVLVVFLCLMPWAGDVYDLLALPMMKTLPEGTHMIATGVVTPFFVPVKVTMMAAFVIALPVVLYQAWAFVAPGLYAHERRMGLPLVMGSTVLFLLGMGFCYFFVFGTVFKFIAEFAPKSITPAPDIEQYLSFVMTMFIAFGLTFEVPVAVILLAKTGVVSVDKLVAARPYVIVGAFVIAAIITPPDVVSQLLLAVPMCLLYEAGVIIARIIVKDRRDGGEQALERIEGN
ncbi:twin-arginine translocase subunit TatC [Aromatoleum petrolei]|uniref:Sec-independent protein translocase protein TatC n=1 Tax=Aromatoleum petrolei TaxID=76116 RepID=A0ABX1MT48_9RHOO|nr:twin-arginine translocase subunit TatC [Aromatoleum petrolei]NMF89773.1 twin-arginine translocase subunit TatC [Aromatoleum petrolei]QTQ37416.1 Sec-independent protein translocase protein [Aromatoleum petrolei]